MRMKDYQAMVEECEHYEDQLTDWERKFLDDVSHRIAEEDYLTDGQIRKLEEIHTKVT